MAEQYEKKESKEIGAGWAKTSKTGTKYYSGVLKFNGLEVEFVIFSNKDKKNDKAPDIRILSSSDNVTVDGKPQAAKPVAKAVAKKPTPPAESEEDIPF